VAASGNQQTATTQRKSRQALLRQSWLTATLSMDQLADAQTDIAAAAASQITNWQSQ
jgi:hypothetical protein